MWPFSKEITKARLEGHKCIRVNGMRFIIKRLNPLLDFPIDKMPQIFADYLNRRPARDPKPTDLKKNIEDMLSIVEAAVVDPVLAGDGAVGITAQDLFRDASLGAKLYIEVLAHSLNAFRGLKGIFFYHRIKWSLWTHWLKDMESNRRMLSSQEAASL